MSRIKLLNIINHNISFKLIVTKLETPQIVPKIISYSGVGPSYLRIVVSIRDFDPDADSAEMSS